MAEQRTDYKLRGFKVRDVDAVVRAADDLLAIWRAASNAGRGFVLSDADGHESETCEDAVEAYGWELIHRYAPQPTEYRDAILATDQDVIVCVVHIHGRPWAAHVATFRSPPNEYRDRAGD